MIEYQSATKIYGAGENRTIALEDVTFAIPRGKVVVLLGPSGCGKTTTLRLTNRLETLSRGDILVDGQSITARDPVKLRQSMGYVIQEIGLFPNKTIAENISTVPKLLGWDRERIEQRLNELFAMIKLDAETFRNRYPAELSGGQQQRIGVARGLAADPDILLMDEPFAAIDPINRVQIQDEFMSLQARLQKTVVFVSHDIQEAIKVGDLIALFSEGRLVQYDTPQAILTRPKNDFVADFLGADRALKVLSLLQVRQVMDREPDLLLPASMPAAEARVRLERQEEPLGVVMAERKPVGFVRPEMLAEREETLEQTAHPFPAAVHEQTSLRDALSLMLMHDLPLLCVLDEEANLAGVISNRLIQDSIVESYAGEEEKGE